MKNKKNILIILLLLIFMCASACEPKEEERTIADLPTSDGYYEYLDENNNEYEGFFVNQQYKGYGTMSYNDGTYYEGTWDEGKWNGNGYIAWNSGCIYIGEVEDGNMHGIGYMIWPMGDYYTGEWKFGNPNGFGTKYFLIDFTAGSVDRQYNIYVGEMSNGLMHGSGKMSYTFGGIYDGEWQQGIRVGKGTYFWEETTSEEVPWIKYVGQFSSDWINGEGTLYFRDGSILTGTFDGENLPLTAD